MAEPFTAPKGTYDVLPDQQPARRWVIATAEKVFARYGYRRIDTPAFEDTRLFTRGVGDSTDIVRKEMYTFTDLGGRSMTLRPEGTAPVARAYVEHGMHTLPQPVKLYYHSPMFRYESPQSGRYRQHHQLGVEAFGSLAPELDAEVIGVLAAVYFELGLAGIELRLNSMGCRDCRPGYSAALRDYLQGASASLCGECLERARINPLRTFDCKVPACRSALEGAPRLSDYLCPACAEHHARVTSCLQKQGLAFVEDHTLVRGMDYYTRTTFEFQSSLLGAQSGIGGGGRYDDLVAAIGGPDIPGVGFGTGVERILLAVSRSEVQVPAAPAPSAYLVALGDEARSEVFALAHEMRARGAAVDLDYMARSAKGQMKQAGRTGARYAVIIGDAELASGTVTLRDLAGATERRVSRAEAVALVTAAPTSAGVGAGASQDVKQGKEED
jgi:histidyl-tRNA synthetase